MTSLKCWNSGVESKAGSFITLPKRLYAFRAPVSSLSSWARSRRRRSRRCQGTTARSSLNCPRRSLRHAIGNGLFEQSNEARL
jgi:hypothetical protein